MPSSAFVSVVPSFFTGSKSSFDAKCKASSQRKLAPLPVFQVSCGDAPRSSTPVQERYLFDRSASLVLELADTVPGDFTPWTLEAVKAHCAREVHKNEHHATACERCGLEWPPFDMCHLMNQEHNDAPLL
eukprot:EC121254.1.p1 GENE.EC121254.1~~EC121254.1.p1  ORF type:complete len:130 (+),score=9.27 EC121254.1:183-572(+)